MAEQAARTRAAQAAAAAAAPPPRQETPPPVTPQPVANPRPLIQGVIEAYGRALESRDVNQVRQAYPGLTPRQAQGWTDFFRLAREVNADLNVTDLQLQDDKAEATVSGTMAYVDRSGKQQRQPMSFKANLERSLSGWRILQIR